jgi:hypothetical protein
MIVLRVLHFQVLLIKNSILSPNYLKFTFPLSRRRLPLSCLLREAALIPLLPTTIPFQNQTLIIRAPYHERLPVVTSPGLGTVLKGLAGWEPTSWRRKQRHDEERRRRMEDGRQRGRVTPLKMGDWTWKSFTTNFCKYFMRVILIRSLVALAAMRVAAAKGCVATANVCVAAARPATKPRRLIARADKGTRQAGGAGGQPAVKACNFLSFFESFFFFFLFLVANAK